MKDRENIKNINKLSIAYIMLKGLKGQTLEKENPYLIYLMYNMFFKERNTSDENKESTSDEIQNDIKNTVYLIDYKKGIEENVDIIPNDLFHMIIQESYDMYLSLNEINNLVDPNIKEQITQFLDSKENFINELVDNFKSALISIILNFNSKSVEYNAIKVDILKNELQYVVEIEDYDTAIIYRDKIKDTEKRISEFNEISE